jgi:hypothetical protein
LLLLLLFLMCVCAFSLSACVVALLARARAGERERKEVLQHTRTMQQQQSAVHNSFNNSQVRKQARKQLTHTRCFIDVLVCEHTPSLW